MTEINGIIQYTQEIERIVSHFNLNLDLININDIVCRKHINRDLQKAKNDDINDNDNFNINDFGANYDENNNVETPEDNEDYSSDESFKLNELNDASSSTEDEVSLDEDIVSTNDNLVIDVKRTNNKFKSILFRLRNSV